MLSKSDLRKELKRKRLELARSETVSRRNARLSGRVANYLEKRTPSIWASYQPRTFEANPNLELKRTPHRWVFPRVDGQTLRFFEPLRDSDWESGIGGIREPKLFTLNEVETNELAGMLVPGVAFDEEGRRLGSGLGFYDRVLARFDGLKVGITWEPLVCAKALVVESHDIPMDVVITEDGVREVGKG